MPAPLRGLQYALKVGDECWSKEWFEDFPIYLENVVNLQKKSDYNNLFIFFKGVLSFISDFQMVFFHFVLPFLK